jgi:phosphotransferase system  glucose/maltose/N-acetylglucosamine-specific IIC component
MFTIGIFTTHIPYIAFVVFYVFFVLFGVGKASSGELTSGENQILSSYSVAYSSAEDVEENVSVKGNISTSAIFSPGSNKIILSNEKNTHRRFQSDNFNQILSCLSLFCRPPPAFI